MSTETLTRILEETSARLAVACHGAETQAAGIDHMKRIGADLAETVFTHVGDASLGDAGVNTLILENLLGLQRAVAESFEAFGVTDDPFLDRCQDAAANGFLDRCEVLFSAQVMGGSA